MNRISLIQELINRGNFSTYLEIGSQSGKSFLPVKCKYKIAVDPVFNIPIEKKLKWLFKNPLNIRNRYFEETSDDFFLKRDYVLKTKGIDVVLVDGLHTFKASLTDVLNSLVYLNYDGIIILHDCYPPNNAAATPAMSKSEASKIGIEGWTGEWCGDVWKTIVYLKKYLSEFLECYVIDTDYGLGVVRVRKKIITPLIIDLNLYNEVDKFEYEYMVQNIGNMLDLRDKGFVEELINRAPYELDPKY